MGKGLRELDGAAELAELRARLAEAEDVLQAIRSGAVDALVVTGSQGERVYTLAGADRIYRQLIETMNEGAATLSVDGVILYCNARLAKMLDRPPEHVVGTALRSYLSSADQPVLDAIVARAQAVPSHGEFMLRTGQHGITPVYISASHLESDGAGVVSCLVLTDLSDQKRYEGIVADERLARSILEQAAEAIIVCDAQGEVIRASQTAHRLCGGSPLLRPFADMFRLDIEGSGSFHLDDVLRGVTFRSVNVTLNREGQSVVLILNAGPLRTGREVLGCVVTLTDITERARTERAIGLQSAALNAAANAIVITDSGGTIVWINRAFTTLTGYGPEEAVGKNPRDLVNSGVHDRAFYDQMWNTILAGNVWRGKITNRRKDGTHYTEYQTITPVRNNRGEVEHFVAMKQDLTEQQQLESQFLQSQKMETVGRLAGGIAHDFNNLLTVINGTAELAVAELREEDPTRAALDDIMKSGARAAALTRQLLAFSRKQVMRPEVVNLNLLVANLHNILRRLIGEDIALVVTPGDDLGSIRADTTQIEQVVLNLVVNARDAMPDGGTLVIETRNADVDDADSGGSPPLPPGRYVALEIRDTGIGMDLDTRGKAFEPFFTTKGPGKGTGLGLSTVYGIVAQSGGGIHVESEVGQGTAFTIHLPRVEAVADTVQPTPVAVSGGNTETILIVEDEEGVCHLATRALQLAGYRVLTARSGEEAVRVVQQQDSPIDLVFTDMIMPGMTGRKLADALAEFHLGIKVLFTSGYTEDAILRQGLDPTAHFIGKPYTVTQLRHGVREALDAAV